MKLELADKAKDDTIAAHEMRDGQYGEIVGGTYAGRIVRAAFDGSLFMLNDTIGDKWFNRRNFEFRVRLLKPGATLVITE